MESHYMQDLDWLILAIYFVVLITIGLWASSIVVRITIVVDIGEIGRILQKLPHKIIFSSSVSGTCCQIAAAS